MVKCTQTTRRLLPKCCLIVFGHFVGLALKGLTLAAFPRQTKSYFQLQPMSEALTIANLRHNTGVSQVNLI